MSGVGLLSFAVSWVALASLQSDTDCPSAEAVDAALSELGVGATASAATVKIRATQTGFVVELAWPEAPQAQVRRLDMASDCAARARAAAVVLAPWLGSLPMTALPTPVVERRRPPSATKPVAAPPTAEMPWRFGMGIGAGSTGDGDVAPVLVLEGTRRLSRRAGLAVAASASGPRQRTLGPGTSHFLRPTLTLLARGLWPAGAAHLGLDAGLAGGVTVAWGTDYSRDETQAAFAWGPTVGLRMLVGSSRIRPWLAARLSYWARAERLRYDDWTTGIAATTTVSPVEAWFALGFDLGVP